MNTKFNFNLFVLLMAIILIFNFNTKSHAKGSSDRGERVATFVIATDGGMKTRFAKQHYSSYVDYNTDNNEITSYEQGALSYYTNWTGWDLADLKNSTINIINFYNSNDSYVTTTGALDKPYSVILPGDAEGISGRIGKKILKVPGRKATAKINFSLLCQDAVYPVSSKLLSITLQ